MRVDDAKERQPLALAQDGFSDQVIILRKQNAPKGLGAIKQLGIGSPMVTIFVSGQHVYPEQPQANRDSGRHVMIHIQSDTHGSRPCAFSFMTNGEGTEVLRTSST